MLLPSASPIHNSYINSTCNAEQLRFGGWEGGQGRLRCTGDGWQVRNKSGAVGWCSAIWGEAHLSCAAHISTGWLITATHSPQVRSKLMRRGAFYICYCPFVIPGHCKRIVDELLPLPPLSAIVFPIPFSLPPVILPPYSHPSFSIFKRHRKCKQHTNNSRCRLE